MPKIKRLTTYMGNLLNPLGKHMQKVDFIVSPYDPKGNKIAEYFINNFKNGDPKLKLPNYKCTVNTDYKSANTYVVIKYKNNWVNKIVFQGWNLEDLLIEMKNYNKIVDCKLIR